MKMVIDLFRIPDAGRNLADQNLTIFRSDKLEGSALGQSSLELSCYGNFVLYQILVRQACGCRADLPHIAKGETSFVRFHCTDGFAGSKFFEKCPDRSYGTGINLGSGVCEFIITARASFK